MASRVRHPIRAVLSRGSRPPGPRPSGPRPCLHDPGQHTGTIAGKGKYIYSWKEGHLYNYIPTRDELFPTVLSPELSEDEAKYIMDRIKNNPDSLAKPGTRFPVAPYGCKYMVVQQVHRRVVIDALFDYYGKDGGKMPCSDYAKRLMYR